MPLTPAPGRGSSESAFGAIETRNTPLNSSLEGGVKAELATAADFADTLTRSLPVPLCFKKKVKLDLGQAIFQETGVVAVLPMTRGGENCGFRTSNFRGSTWESAANFLTGFAETEGPAGIPLWDCPATRLFRRQKDRSRTSQPFNGIEQGSSP